MLKRFRKYSKVSPGSEAVVILKCDGKYLLISINNICKKRCLRIRSLMSGVSLFMHSSAVHKFSRIGGVSYCFEKLFNSSVLMVLTNKSELPSNCSTEERWQLKAGLTKPSFGALSRMSSRIGFVLAIKWLKVELLQI